MSSEMIIYGCIGMCILLLGICLCKDLMFKIIFQGIIGTSIIVILNGILPEILQLGINYGTVVGTSVLGLPGVLMMYFLNYYL